ncbi:multiubiquitin domain-containing protein [Streptacidiphilus cavernicola]|uniref:Multiubiquitin domain-containing protein n=1 Tax=Streptacidiphilus cavernicola TaxID=3342716 RepID=A0ABV6W613_9ACTN
MSSVTAESVQQSERGHEYKIFVNTRERTVHEDELSFEHVVRLAYDPVPQGPGVTFTVGYRHAAQHPAEGTLVAGQSVKVKNRTVFNVTQTDKS